MIARICIFILLFIVLPDVYIYARYVRRRTGITLWQRLLWWAPAAILIAYTIALSLIPDFAPYELAWLNVYLFLLGLIAVPKLLFVFCSSVGLLLRRFLHIRRNWGNYAGLLLVLGQLYVLFTGSMIGTDRLAVNEVTIEFDDLPAAFDGYRIAQFSDIHLGSMRTELLERAVAEINKQHPDLIAFTGDIQNMRPQELTRFAPVLARLKAKDGVYSVLGNHDYSQYMPKLDEAHKRANERLTRSFQTSIGWNLLLNDNCIIRRSADSIVVAGEENDGRPPFPQKADLGKTLRGVSAQSFVVMLQHDPSAWRRSILPKSKAQLTLSGHTHGGQASFFGWRPTELLGREDAGLYREGNRALYVSTGLGGFVPFRFHMDPEVVVITLKKSRNK